MSYQNKYLKYKNKYLNLKGFNGKGGNLIGGVNFEEGEKKEITDFDINQLAFLLPYNISNLTLKKFTENKLPTKITNTFSIDKSLLYPDVWSFEAFNSEKGSGKGSGKGNTRPTYIFDINSEVTLNDSEEQNYHLLYLFSSNGNESLGIFLKLDTSGVYSIVIIYFYTSNEDNPRHDRSLRLFGDISELYNLFKQLYKMEKLQEVQNGHRINCYKYKLQDTLKDIVLSLIDETSYTLLKINCLKVGSGYYGILE